MVGFGFGPAALTHTAGFFLLLAALTSALLQPLGKRVSPRSGLGVAQDIERPPTFLDERADAGDLNVLFVDESEEEGDDSSEQEKGAGRRRWENLNPKIKQRLVERGQAKAIANKQKREPARDRKRREYN